MKRYIKVILYISFTSLLFTGCDWFEKSDQAPNPRLSLFIGVDISGSFMNSGYFDDSIEFMAYYLYGHLNGIEGLEVPNVLFVGSIGGAQENEAKTFYPIQTFQNKSVQEIHQKLLEIFPKDVKNPFTDYNAFFEQVAMTVRNRNLILRPISIVMLSDGIPDIQTEGKSNFKSINTKPLENLARSVTLRLLYTNAIVGKNWQTQVPRQRVKIWTQDADVMTSWKDSGIFLAEKPVEEQTLLVDWIQDNVDFGVRPRRVK